MGQYKEVSIQEVLKLTLGDIVYFKKFERDGYHCGQIRYSRMFDCLGIYTLDELEVFYFNILEKDFTSYEIYSYYVKEKPTTYSAQEILDKIVKKELTDDDILIDKNGEQDTFDDILETDVMALIDYAPYTIKERKAIKMYYVDEIIKMVRENKLKEGDRIVCWHNESHEDYIFNGLNFKNETTDEELELSTLLCEYNINNKFSIRERNK